MKVGINLPWGRYGQDIGRELTAAQTSSSGSAQGNAASSGQTNSKPLFAPGLNQDKTVLDTLFSSYKKLGIDCVRWFLLADGVNLNPPTLDKAGKWHVPITTLQSFGHLRDFGQILDVCKRQSMLLMPVFVDNTIFAPPAVMLRHLSSPESVAPTTPSLAGTSNVPIPPGTKSVNDFVNNFYQDPVQKVFRDDTQSVDWNQFIKGGRAPVMAKSDQINSFLNSTLAPLLDVAQDYTDQILAWDLINEPEVGLWRSTSQFASVTPDPVSGDGMAYFIGAGLQMILKAGFTATVGFQTAMPLGKDDGFQSNHNNSDGLKSNIQKISKVISQNKYNANPKFILQCHYYPTDATGRTEQDTLLKASDFGAGPTNLVVLGEFASKIDVYAQQSPWAKDISGVDTLATRLQVVQSKEYDWAFPWSATDGIERSSFNPKTQLQYQFNKNDKQLLPVSF